MKNFYTYHIIFAIKEEFEHISSALTQAILYPFFVWLFSRLWINLSATNHIEINTKLVFYIGLTMILFLTTLRGTIVENIVEDYALSLTRPRYWPAMMGSYILGSQFGRRCILLLVYIVFGTFVLSNYHLAFTSAMRFFTLLPILCFVEVFYSLLIIILQIYAQETTYFRLAITKVFMVFGGVFAPLNQLQQPLSNILNNLPIADIFFQPCYFSVYGQFYHLSMLQWLLRISYQIIVLGGITIISYHCLRKHYNTRGA